MKKYKIFIITIILLAVAVVITPTKTYADGDSPSENVNIYKYGARKGSLGLQLGMNQPSTQQTTSLVNGGKKCGPSDLCFSGRGMFVYLLRYDPNTKTETVIGEPILYHTGSFLKKQIVVASPAEDAEINADNKMLSLLITISNYQPTSPIGQWLADGIVNLITSRIGRTVTPPSCSVNIGTAKYEFEKLIIYDPSNIEYKVNGQTISKENIQFKPISSNIISPTNEEELAVLDKYIREEVIAKLNTYDNIASAFKCTPSNNCEIDKANIDKYYVAIEYADRKGESVDTAIQEKASNKSSDTKEETIKETPIKYQWKCPTDKWYGKKERTPISYEKPDSDCPSTYDLDCKRTAAAPLICNYSSDCYSSGSCTPKPDGSSIWASGGKVCTCDCTQAYTKNQSCNSENETDCKCDRDYNNDGGWQQVKCEGAIVKFTKELYTLTYQGKSTVETARSSGNRNLISQMFTPLDKSECTGSPSDNCTIERYETKEGAVVDTIVEYFIGPDLESALVGYPSENKGKNTYKYLFYDPSIPNASTSRYAIGVSYWWVNNMTVGSGCLQECNENDLRCAENYCQNLLGNEAATDIYKKKRDCIINQCKVKEPENPCKSTKYNNDYLRLLNNTSCNTTTKQYSCGNPDSEENLPYDKNGPVTNKSYPTLWCYTDASDTNISLRSFINVSCAESQLVSFVDVSKQRLTTGVGIEYNAGIKGQKVCNVWFDMDRWQLEYASYGEKERLCLPGDEIDEYKRCPENDEKGPLARDVLNEILKHYNEMAEYGKDIKYKDGSIREKDKIYDTIASIMSAEERTNALITWEDLDYQLEDLSTGATTKISEALNNKGLASGDYILQKNIDNNPEVSTLKSLNTEITKGKTFARTNATEVTAKTFKTVSETEVHYAFDKYCVSQDGKGTITKNDGVCYTIKDKNGSPKEIRGQRLYYTSLKSLGNIEKYKFSIDKTVAKVATVKPTIPSDGLEYSHICPDREYNDSCELKLEDEPEDIPPCEEEDCPEPEITTKTNNPQCSIITTSDNGIKDGIYFGSVNISVMSDVKLINDSIESIKIKVNGVTYEQSEYTISLQSSDPITEKYEIVGTITTKNGKKVECDDEVTIAQQRNNCVIEVKDNSDPQDIIYKVSGVGSIPEIFTSRDETRVKASLADGEYLFRIKRSEVEKGIVIFAVTSNGSVQCYKSFPDGDPPCEDCPPGDTPGGPDSVNCYEWNKNFDKTRAEVADYCVNWEKDVTKFNGKEDCTNKCWKSNCPIVYSCDEKGIEPVRQYCSTKYGANTKEESQCISRCTQFSCDTGDYLYRPIDIEDPFPRSSKSAFNAGTRKIGGNWVGFERYITDDYEDSSTLTGPNANISVEYIVDLSLDDIRSIRNSTAKEKVGENNGYTDYQETKWTDEGTGNQYITDYKSSFIHSQYKRLFQQGINSNGQYYNATGNIE